MCCQFDCLVRLQDSIARLGGQAGWIEAVEKMTQDLRCVPPWISLVSFRSHGKVAKCHACHTKGNFGTDDSPVTSHV